VAETVIGKGIQVEGAIESQGEVWVLGKVEGPIDAALRIEIGRGASVRGALSAKEIAVAGLVQGPLVAKERIEIDGGGAVLGDLTAPRMTIADGARFEGTVYMDRKRGDEGDEEESL